MAASIAARIALVLGGVFIALGLALVAINGRFDRYSLASLIWGILLLTVFGFFEPETVRGLLGRGTVRAGSLAMVQVVLVLAAAVLINGVVRGKLANTQLDLSKNQVNTLSPETLQVLQSLDHPVNVTLWYSQSPSETATAFQLLQRYHAVTGRFHVDQESLVTRPDLRAAQNLTVIQAGLMVFQYNGKQDQSTDATEQGITSTLLKLTAGGSPKAYFLAGHGEGSTADTSPAGYSFLLQQLTQQGFTTSDLNLVSGSVPGVPGAASPPPAPASPAASPSPGATPAPTTTIPADADMVVVMNPRTPLGADELGALQTYFEHGGRLLIAAAPGSRSNLNDLIKKYGLNFSGGDVVDPSAGLRQEPDVLVANSYPARDITRGLAGEDSIIPVATPIKGTAATGYTETAIISSSSDACEVTDGSHRQQCQGGDAKGPFTVYATLEQGTSKSGTRLSRMVLVGTSVFAENDLLQSVQVAPGNLSLAINSFNWLAQRDKVINIPARDTQPDQVYLSDQQKSVVLYGYIIFLPALIGLAGLAVYLRHR
jgi:hypothetical protein